MVSSGTVTVVVMGVSGVGKSTVADALARLTGCTFADGDAFHSSANRAKMRAGRPLDDADRAPWLRRIAGWIGEQEARGHDAVVACSALRRRYRDVLCDGHPSVRFAHLVADPVLVGRRLEARRGHFMPPSLLASQVATLEPLAEDEPGVVVPVQDDPAATAAAVLRGLGLVSRAGSPP